MFHQTQNMKNNVTYKFSNQERMIFGLSEVAANAVSAVACAFVILIIVTYKKHQFVIQRLLLYLTINLLMYSIVHIFQGASYKILLDNEKYCQALACLYLFTRLCVRVSLMCIILELYLCMILKKDTTQMKWIYFAAIYLIPAGVTWIPFALQRFGYNGIQCYITYHSEQTNKYYDIDHTGFVLILVLDWLPLGAAFITMGPIYWFFLYCIRQQGKQYTPLVEVTRNTIYRQTIKDLSYAKWFPIVFFIIDMFALTVVIISVLIDYYNITLWTLSFVVLGLHYGAVALILVFDPKTRKMLNWNRFKAAWNNNILGRNIAETYPIIRVEHGDSVPNTPTDT